MEKVDEMNPFKKFEELGGTNPKLFIALVVFFSVLLALILYKRLDVSDKEFSIESDGKE